MSGFPKKEKQEPVRTGTIIDGAFMCQECDEVVNRAMHNRQTQKLTWECSNGHESSIAFRM